MLRRGLYSVILLCVGCRQESRFPLAVTCDGLSETPVRVLAYDPTWIPYQWGGTFGSPVIVLGDLKGRSSEFCLPRGRFVVYLEGIPGRRVAEAGTTKHLVFTPPTGGREIGLSCSSKGEGWPVLLWQQGPAFSTRCPSASPDAIALCDQEGAYVCRGLRAGAVLAHSYCPETGEGNRHNVSGKHDVVLFSDYGTKVFLGLIPLGKNNAPQRKPEPVFVAKEWNISGRVVDDGENPVPGARLKVDATTVDGAVAGMDGRFMITTITYAKTPIDSLRVRACAPDDPLVCGDADANPRTRDLTITIRPRKTITIRGRVIDGDGRMVEGATVLTNNVHAYAMSDRSGRFDLRLTDGESGMTHNVYAWKDGVGGGWYPYSPVLCEHFGDLAEMEIVLDSVARVAVEVEIMDPLERPVARTPVSVVATIGWGEEEAFVLQSITDALGRIRVGDYWGIRTISVRERTCFTSRNESVRPGMPVRICLRALSYLQVQFSVPAHAGGRSLVCVYMPHDDGSIGSCVCSCEVSVGCAFYASEGPNLILALMPDGRHQMASAELPPRRLTKVTLTPTRTHALSGGVIRRGKASVQNLLVSAAHVCNGVAIDFTSAWTDGGGHFCFPTIPEGDTRLSVYDPKGQSESPWFDEQEKGRLLGENTLSVAQKVDDLRIEVE